MILRSLLIVATPYLYIHRHIYTGPSIYRDVSTRSTGSILHTHAHTTHTHTHTHTCTHHTHTRTHYTHTHTPHTHTHTPDLQIWKETYKNNLMTHYHASDALDANTRLRAHSQIYRSCSLYNVSPVAPQPHIHTLSNTLTHTHTLTHADSISLRQLHYGLRSSFAPIYRSLSLQIVSHLALKLYTHTLTHPHTRTHIRSRTHTPSQYRWFSHTMHSDRLSRQSTKVFLSQNVSHLALRLHTHTLTHTLTHIHIHAR